MTKTIELSSTDGHKFPAYVAEPRAKPKGAIVVVQEIFGVNKHIRSVADGYAADGYLAIAPAYYDRVQRNYETGYDPKEIEAGVAVMQKLNWDQVLADTAAAIAQVKAAGKVAIVGYCWGGTVAWLAAARLDGLACAIPYYGGGMFGFIGEKPKVPIMCQFGELDQSPSLEQAKAISAAHPAVVANFYAGAGHGFNCDERGSYNAAAAGLARTRTLEFLARNVG